MTATTKIDYLLAKIGNIDPLKVAIKASIKEQEQKNPQKKPIDFSDFAKPGILSDASSSKKPAQKAINNNNNKKGPSV
tara:strand:- start:118 stop:351 length:234 start_codon:yes stop_codon:yes gene_type:complete